jgi:hypothetical protein
MGTQIDDLCTLLSPGMQFSHCIVNRDIGGKVVNGFVTFKNLLECIIAVPWRKIIIFISTFLATELMFSKATQPLDIIP